MKSSLIPIACGTALALMTGAAATHWCAVRDMVALAKQMPEGPRFESAPLYPAPAPLPDDRIAQEARDLLAEARGHSPVARNSRSEGSTRPAAALRPSVSAPAPAGTDARIEKLLTALEGAVEQNQELRDRLADTNRDVMELRFQVDSYSGQFRPLRVEEEPTYYDDATGGVLPPLEAP